MDPQKDLHQVRRSKEKPNTHIRRKKETALETMKHEFIDYIVSKPYTIQLKITNKLIESINEIAYQMKEDLVEKISTLIR